MNFAGASLAQITDLLTDGTHYTPPNAGSGIPFLTVKDVSDSGLDFYGAAKISKAEFEKAKSQNSAPQVGDVLFSKDGTVGKVHLVTEQQPFAVLSSLAILRPGQNLHSNYLAHFLRTPAARSAAERRKTGSAIRRIVLRDLANLTIPLPPLDEQRRIAAILDKADALRRKRKRTIELLDSLPNAVFSRMVRTGAKSSRSLGSCLSFITSGGRNWTKYLAEDGDRFIRSLDVQRGWIANKDAVFVAAPDNAEANRTRTQKGDVLLTITGSRIGRASRLPDELAGSFVSQHVAILRPISQKVIPSFLASFLISDAGQQQISKWQYGQTKPGLNFEQIRRFEIPDLPMEEQRSFVRKCDAANNQLDQLKDNFEELEMLFASLQHRAFSGEL